MENKVKPKYREVGYYWAYNNKRHVEESWDIYYWDSVTFRDGDEVYSEDCFSEIDENQIIRKLK